MTTNEKIMENPIVKEITMLERNYNPLIGEIIETFAKEISKNSITTAIVSTLKAGAILSAIRHGGKSFEIPCNQNTQRLVFTQMMSDYIHQHLWHEYMITEVYSSLQKKNYAPTEYFEPFSSGIYNHNTSTFFRKMYEKYTSLYVNAMEIIFDYHRKCDDMSNICFPAKNIRDARDFFNEFSYVWIYEWSFQTEEESNRSRELSESIAQWIRSYLMEINNTTNLKDGLINKLPNKRDGFQMMPIYKLYALAKKWVPVKNLKENLNKFLGEYEGTLFMNDNSKFINSLGTILQI